MEHSLAQVSLPISSDYLPAVALPALTSRCVANHGLFIADTGQADFSTLFTDAGRSRYGKGSRPLPGCLKRNALPISSPSIWSRGSLLSTCSCCTIRRAMSMRYVLTGIKGVSCILFSLLIRAADW